MSADHVRVDYKVELNDEQDAGKWWCMFRGQSSDPIELQYQPAEKKTVALPQLNPETTKTPGSHNTTHVVPLNGNGSAVKLVVKNATHETQSSIVDTDLLFGFRWFIVYEKFHHETYTPTYMRTVNEVLDTTIPTQGRR
ncbi:unnamed protein product [Echinostoma caproni]|uniref:Ig-like domain-containing protein n=1 Tax=Echinostoma caproni TaxID=27848 RepID=A0A183AAS9_9TREM|nr:unnamed protein product [Echinostoma caproni]